MGFIQRIEMITAAIPLLITTLIAISPQRANVDVYQTFVLQGIFQDGCVMDVEMYHPTPTCLTLRVYVEAIEGCQGMFYPEPAELVFENTGDEYFGTYFDTRILWQLGGHWNHCDPDPDLNGHHDATRFWLRTELWSYEDRVATDFSVTD